MSKSTESLVMVWSSQDREVALNMVFMYTYNAKAKGWWPDVRLIVWGAATRLLAQDHELQEYVKKMGDVGVVLEACKKCADNYGVSSRLEELGINVYYIGEQLTAYLRDGRHVLTF